MPQMGATAMFREGSDYYSGKNGKQQDHKKAAELYQAAANQGQPAAQYWLGCMYQSGEGVAKDLKRAVELLLAAADQGDDDEAQCKLGGMYATGGLGVAQDTAMAYWHTKAAAQGNEGAALALA